MRPRYKVALTVTSLLGIVAAWFVVKRPAGNEVILPHGTQSAIATNDTTALDYTNWSVDATAPGSSLPPAGLSLFDHLVTNGRGGYDLPFPFTALLQQLAQRAHCTHAARGAYEDCYQAVLIPLGRSLQRTAAGKGAFYQFPRAVFAMVADDAQESGAPLTQDRLYLGYHEAAEIVEVISYNEAVGRFEFQLVTDYRAGAVARVNYANRAICVACHQNQAPIFSRQVWDETNANPAIARRLLATGRDFYGVQVDRGVDIPQAIDAAVGRANLFAAHQLLWQRGCGGDDGNDMRARRCRAAVFLAGLQYALSGELGYDAGDRFWRDDFAAVFDTRWQRRWTGGLKLPDAGLPNRDPLLTQQSSQFAHVAAKFEPLRARPYETVWPGDAARWHLVTGIGATLSRADAIELNRALARQRDVASRTYSAQCALLRTTSGVQRTRFDCESDDKNFRLRGKLERDTKGDMSGTIDQLRLPDGEAVPGVTLDQIKAVGTRYRADLVRGALPARGRRGQRLTRFELREVSAVRAETSIAVVEDFGAVRAAVTRIVDDPGDDAFADLPFRRARVLATLWRELGIPQRDWCCLEAAGMHAAQSDAANSNVPAKSPDAELAPFLRYCATCHQSSERTPPNFLRAGSQPIAQGVQRCAPRIYYRLAMWQLAPEQREKTPMPPEIALRGLYAHAADWPRGTELATMKAYAARSIKDFDEHALLAQPYETLRSCLPERTSMRAQQ
jgi:cytochrome c553